MYMIGGRDDDALSQVNQVLARAAGRTDALRLMAIINFRQNNLDAAWDDFKDLLASGATRWTRFSTLRELRIFARRHDRAIRLYAEVMDGRMRCLAARGECLQASEGRS